MFFSTPKAQKKLRILLWSVWVNCRLMQVRCRLLPLTYPQPTGLWKFRCLERNPCEHCSVIAKTLVRKTVLSSNAKHSTLRATMKEVSSMPARLSSMQILLSLFVHWLLIKMFRGSCRCTCRLKSTKAQINIFLIEKEIVYFTTGL